MTQLEFQKFQQSLFEQAAIIRDTKGKEYATESNAFANFDDDARDSQGKLTRLDAAFFHYNKQVRAIRSYVQNRQEYSRELIGERFVDAINYLSLMAGMIVDDKEIAKEIDRKWAGRLKEIDTIIDGSIDYPVDMVAEDMFNNDPVRRLDE